MKGRRKTSPIPIRVPALREFEVSPFVGIRVYSDSEECDQEFPCTIEASIGLLEDPAESLADFVSMPCSFHKVDAAIPELRELKSVAIERVLKIRTSIWCKLCEDCLNGTPCDGN